LLVHDVAEYIHEDVLHPPFFIQHLLPRGGVLLLFGDAGVMKSWIAMYTAFCVSTGSDWLDFHTVQGRCLLVNFEISEYGYHDRLVKVASSFTLERQKLYSVTPGIKFLDETATMAWFYDEIIQPYNPEVIILDCLAKCFGGDENSNQDLGRFFQSVGMLTAEGRTVVIIHHCNKNQLIPSPMGRARGGTRLIGDPDTVIYLADQPSGKQLQFLKTRLSTVELYSKNIVFENYLWRLR